MYWEITTRSNIFTNSILILLILRGFAGINPKTKPWKFILTALLTGFLLSTRSVFVLVYLVFFLSALRNREIEFKRISLFLTIAVLAFAGSFLPFILLFKDDFFTINPFIIQSSFLVPQVYTLAFMIIALFLAFLVKEKRDKYFYSGLSLFLAILIYAVYLIRIFGFQTAFIHSKIDISYFLFCVPFFFYYLSTDELIVNGEW